MKEPALRIIIADDHQMFIDGIQAVLAGAEGIEVVGEAHNGHAVLKLLETQPTDIVLMDINMPDMDGMAATEYIFEHYKDVKVLMLTMYKKKEFITQMLEKGASGYILKNTGKEELIRAIRKVGTGATYYGEEVTAAIMESLREPAKKKQAEIPLTKRETEVLKLIAQGHTNQEMADKLFISLYTVETHRKNLVGKLDIRNTAKLVQYAIKMGLIESP